jgi:uncharacterized SAM-binding protein YcdF (DUF218 family)
LGYPPAVKLLFTTLFLPLGLTLLGLAVTLWLLWRRPRRGPLPRAVPVLLGVTLILSYLMATPLVGRALGGLLFNAVQGRELARPQDADAIIVLTGGMVQAGPVGWLPRAETMSRLAVAYEAQRLINLRLPVIVSGGHTAGVQNPSEAKVAADFFARNRSEITPTELEQTSTDTYESAMQLAPLVARRQYRNVLLVTSDVHMLRALAMFRARGVDAIPFPALSLPQNLGIRTILPSVYGLALTTDALYEAYALAAALITGEIGPRDLSYSPPQVDVPALPAAAAAANPIRIETAPPAPAAMLPPPRTHGPVIGDPIGSPANPQESE